MTQPHLDDLTPFAHSAQNRCFGCGQANRGGLKLEFLLAPDGSVVCPATISDQFKDLTVFCMGASSLRFSMSQ